MNSIKAAINECLIVLNKNQTFLHDLAVKMSQKLGPISDYDMSKATIDYRVTEEEIRDMYLFISYANTCDTVAEICTKSENVFKSTTSAELYDILVNLKKEVTPE